MDSEIDMIQFRMRCPMICCLPTTQLASDIVEGDIIHMMSLVDFESVYHMRVLIEDVTFSIR